MATFMTTVLLSLVALYFCDCKQRFVKYNIQSVEKFQTECGVKGMFNDNIEIKIDGESGECSVLSETSTTPYSENYTYIKKTAVVEDYGDGLTLEYQEQDGLTLEYQEDSFELPLQLVEGITVDIELILTTRSNWNRVCIWFTPPYELAFEACSTCIFEAGYASMYTRNNIEKGPHETYPAKTQPNETYVLHHKFEANHVQVQLDDFYTAEVIQISPLDMMKNLRVKQYSSCCTILKRISFRIE